MSRLFGFLFAVALGMAGLAAEAQTGAAKPACATGDTVVWENTRSKAYHLPGDKFYGNTKHGAYACRSAADRAGYHLVGGKSAPKSSETLTSPAPLSSETPAGYHHGKHHHKSGATAPPSPEPSPAAT